MYVLTAPPADALDFAWSFFKAFFPDVGCFCSFTVTGFSVGWATAGVSSVAFTFDGSPFIWLGRATVVAID